MASIKIEKVIRISIISDANPAKGFSPPDHQKMISAKIVAPVIKLENSPTMDNHDKGCELYAKMLREACPIIPTREVPSHFDSPANLGGRSISIIVDLKHIKELRPRMNL